MTPEQITMARALCRCNFGFAGDRHFARDMAERANLFPANELPEKLAEKLARAVVRFHVQIKPDVVKLARAALPVEGEQA